MFQMQSLTLRKGHVEYGGLYTTLCTEIMVMIENGDAFYF